MSLTEILIIVAVILGIILLPRKLGKRPEPEIRLRNRVLKLTGWQRMAILISFLWLAFFALYLKPWNNKWHIFFYAGLGPIILSWGIFWIFLGFRKKDRWHYTHSRISCISVTKDIDYPLSDATCCLHIFFGAWRSLEARPAGVKREHRGVKIGT